MHYRSPKGQQTMYCFLHLSWSQVILHRASIRNTVPLNILWKTIQQTKGNEIIACLTMFQNALILSTLIVKYEK